MKINDMMACKALGTQMLALRTKENRQRAWEKKKSMSKMTSSVLGEYEQEK